MNSEILQLISHECVINVERGVEGRDEWASVSKNSNKLEFRLCDLNKKLLTDTDKSTFTQKSVAFWSDNFTVHKGSK